MSYLRSINRFILLSLILLGFSISSANAATLNVVGGELIGAFDVSVNGSSYEVSFSTIGTCVALFTGCDEASDFAFNTGALADAASQALLDQVFGADDIYDAEPELTRGVFNTGFGYIVTPWGLTDGGSNVKNDAAINLQETTPDENTCGLGACIFGVSFPISAFSGNIYAVWTPTSPVPLPAALWLFGTALVGLVGFGKCRKAA